MSVNFFRNEPNLWLSGRRTRKQNDSYVPVQQAVHLHTALRLYIVVPCVFSSLRYKMQVECNTVFILTFQSLTSFSPHAQANLRIRLHTIMLSAFKATALILSLLSVVSASPLVPRAPKPPGICRPNFQGANLVITNRGDATHQPTPPVNLQFTGQPTNTFLIR